MRGGDGSVVQIVERERGSRRSAVAGGKADGEMRKKERIIRMYSLYVYL